jgi:hypothetical protein
MQAEVLDPEDDMMQAARNLGDLQKVDTNLTITQERSLFGDIVTAQPIRVPRNEADILRRIDILAAGAGTRWFYRYPVKNRRKGTVDYIEGPTIKCTDAVLMRYKNAAVESRTVAVPGDPNNYVCYSRFCDWENGVSITMGQLVPKSATLGGEDEERRLQIAHNVGQSKSRRNVCVAAMGEFVQRGFVGAKRSLVERIGRDIAKSRGVIAAELNKLGVPNIVARVESVYSRKQSEWLAADIASIYAELQGIEDGFSSVDDTWPLAPPPEPRRSDGEPATVAAGSAAVPDRPVVETGPAAAEAEQPTSPPASAATNPGIEAAKATAETSDAAKAASGDKPMPKNWTVGADVLGQDAIIQRLGELLDMAQSAADVDEIEAQNAERLRKITGLKRGNLNNAFREKRESFGGAP